MLRNSKLLILIFLFSLLFAGVLLWSYTRTSTGESTSGDAALAELEAKSHDLEKNEVSNNFDEFFRKAFYTPSSKRTLVWQDWKWEETMIYGDIIDVSPNDRTILLDVTRPKDVNIRSNYSVPVECGPSETARYYYKNIVYLGGNIDLFKYADKGDLLYTFCLDSECETLGKSCILIDRQND